MSPRLVAVILAGGAARRMGGGDKPLLEIGGRPMLQAVIEAIDLPDIAISANGDPSRFAAFNRPVLADGDFAGEGPLAGLLAGLHWAAGLGAEALLTVPGDMPFLPKGFAERLLPAPRAVISENRRQHLVATWPVGCAGTLLNCLENGKMRRVAAFAETVGTHYIEFPVIPCTSFANINTRGQLELARKLMPTTGRDDSPTGGDWREFDDDDDRCDRRPGRHRPAAGQSD
ncbi:MAG TPA: molybdenum cofactor guanylyltransferase [Rhodopila sp.]|nr:molybdenum cofactor guanylyltransferase [Rhodopila sp.]